MAGAGLFHAFVLSCVFAMNGSSASRADHIRMRLVYVVRLLFLFAVATCRAHVSLLIFVILLFPAGLFVSMCLFSTCLRQDRRGPQMLHTCTSDLVSLCCFTEATFCTLAFILIFGLPTQIHVDLFLCIITRMRQDRRGAQTSHTSMHFGPRLIGKTVLG